MSKRRQQFYFYITIALAALMAITLFLPAITPQTQTTVVPTPTANPVATFPPPVTDFSGINFDSEKYLHTSGLYMIPQPSGFTPTRPSNDGTLLQVNLNNQETLSVIETIVEIPAEPYESLDALSARIDDSFLQNSWRNYNNWTETARFVDEENEQLVIDFELSLGGQNYLARHVAWLQDGWAEMVRVVAPTNARDYLLYLLNNMLYTIERVELFNETPVAWTMYYSAEDGYAIRHPSFWRVTDGGAGVPVTLEGNGGVLRMEKLAGESVEDEDAARAYLSSVRPDAELLSTTAVERNGSSGFAVSYKVITLDGAPESGEIVLLNAEDGLYVANVRVDADVDLLALEEGAPSNAADAAAMLESFNLTDGLGFPEPESAQSAQ